MNNLEAISFGIERATLINSDLLRSAKWPVAEQEPPLWYAAYTRGRHEKSVSRQLEERSIDSFLPLYHSVRRWKDCRKELALPLFPGYVFVNVSARDRLKVLQVPGVVRFVSFSGRPAVLESCDVEAL